LLNTGSETKICALGKEYIVGRLELRVSREFKDWIVKTQLPEPMDKEIFDILPREDQIAYVKEQERTSRDLRCFSLGSELAQKYQQTEEGAAKFAQLMLQKHQPDITEEEAFSVLIEAADQFTAAMQAAQGDKLGNRQPPAA